MNLNEFLAKAESFFKGNETASAKVAELEKQNAELSAQLEKIGKDFSAKVAELDIALKASVDAAVALESERKNHEAAILLVSEQFEAKAAAKAQQIVASISQTPLPVEPSQTPGGGKPGSQLTGLARVQAAFKAQINK